MKDFSEMVQKEINDSPTLFPFIAQLWEMEKVLDQDLIESTYVTYGHFETRSIHSLPFYKPYSKFIDFGIIDRNKNEE